MTQVCLRCRDTRLDSVSASASDIEFFKCPCCGRQYAKQAEGELTFRWPHPVALPLYSVLFEQHSMSRAPEVARTLYQQRPADELASMIEEIERELDQPSQQVRAILDNPQSEEECRAFLRAFVAELRDRLP